MFLPKINGIVLLPAAPKSCLPSGVEDHQAAPNMCGFISDIALCLVFAVNCTMQLAMNMHVFWCSGPLVSNCHYRRKDYINILVLSDTYFNQSFAILIAFLLQEIRNSFIT